MDMIERVARALWDVQYPEGTSWDDWAEQVRRNPGGFDGRDACRKLARAAIEAMREPDEAMLWAMMAADRGVSFATSEWIADAWCAGIDAALPTPPEPVGRG